MSAKLRFPVTAGFGRSLLSLSVLGPLLLGAGPGRAQQDPSPLIGKTILVYNPQPGDTLNLDVGGTGYPMALVAGTNWMALTVPATIQDHFDKFGVRSNYGQNSFWISRTGVASGGADAFDAEDFAGGDSLWIVIDPAGPDTAAPILLTRAPKVVNIFNPWQLTAPAMVMSGGTRKGLLTVPGKCGWYWAFLLKPAEQSFYLEEVNRTDTYGQGGLGDNTPYNVATEFAAKGGSTLWLDTDVNSWLPTYPGKTGYCQYMMAATVRDFSAAHPDFDFGSLTGDHSVPGVVQSSIGPDPGRKPVVNPAAITRDPAISFSQFDKWWVTDSTNPAPSLRSYESCYDIPMSKAGDGSWEYDSFRDSPDHGFWPVEGALNRHNETFASCYVKPPPDSTSWVTNGPRRNGNFCMEAHATFVYQPGQTFSFRGNDDLWVFINGKLVVDLGGLHAPLSANVNLASLGLTAGQTYKWDLFHCNRQPCGSSLRIKTSIYFRQLRALDIVSIAGTGGSQSFQIIKREGGSGSCAGAGDSLREVPATNLVYKVLNVGGSELETLGEGSWHKGGIVIAAPRVTVDTSRIDDLAPGMYRIVAYEPANPKVRVEIPFHVKSGPTGLAKAGRMQNRPAAGSYHDALGRSREKPRTGVLRRFWRIFQP